MRPLARYHRWRVNRRIERLLRGAGMPRGMSPIFKGNVIVKDTVYQEQD
jgi:hypothetical protein